jgi:hypothetical protein
MKEYNKLLSTIPEDQKVELIKKNWRSHDAKWQMKIVHFFGWKIANRYNKEIIQEIGKIMMHRILKALNLNQVNSSEELRVIIGSVITLNFPQTVSAWEMKTIDVKTILIKIRKCPIFENVKRINATNQYECSCFEMRSGFFKALNIEVKQKFSKCLMKGDNCCEIFLIVKGWS